MKASQLLVVVAACAALSAQALTEVKWKAAVDGSFNDPAMWNKEGGPVPGTDYVTIDQNANMTITFPDGGTSSVSPQFRTPYYDKGQTEQKLTLDFLGAYSWLDSPDKDVYNGEPFKFYSPSGHFFNWEGWGGAKYGPAAATNALVKLWMERDRQGSDKYETTIEISRGPFTMIKDHYNKSFQGSLILGHVVYDQNVLRVRFLDHTTNWFGNVGARFNGRDCLYEVSGGSWNYTDNDFKIPDVSDSNFYTNRILVTGLDTYMRIGNFCYLNAESPNRQTITRVTDHARLDVNQLRQNNVGTGRIVADNGGYIKINSIGNFLNKAGSYLDVVAEDGGTLEFGNSQWGGDGITEGCVANLIVSNATLVSNNFNMNRDWAPGPNAKIDVAGGLYLASKNIGRTTVFDFSKAELYGSGTLAIGNGNPCHVVMTNGYAHVGSCNVGHNSAGTLTLGGTARYQSLSQMNIGVNNAQPATVNVRDEAVFDVGYCRMGLNAGAVGAPEVTLNIEGGRLVDTNSQINVCDQQRTCRINLTGGELFSRQTLGWGWAHWSHPEGAGWAAFYGNGGVLRSPGNPSGSFFGRFDEATVGEKGLVIASDVDVNVIQSFANAKDGEGHEVDGLIVLTGAGVKTFKTKDGNYTVAGTPSTHARTVVAGGTALFEKDVLWNTAVVVTNGAVFSVKGDNAGMTLTGLTLGDETTTGTLELDAGDVITVDGPVSLPNGRLAFTATPGKAAYGVLKVLDPDVNFPEAQRVQWERMILSAGHQDGCSYVYTEETDASGALVLTLTVGDPVPLTGDVEWTAQDGTWATGGNWSTGEKPGDLANAVVNKDVTISVDADETVGALALDGDVTIAGDGSLGFTDSGNAAIAVTNGVSTMGAGLFSTFSLPIVPAEDAQLDVAGDIKGRGLRKAGEGGLKLSGTAFGDALELADGVVTFAGEDEKVVDKLALAATVDRNRIGIKADVPVTVKSLAVTKGFIAKAGVAPLVIESDKIIDVTKEFNDADNNSAYSQDFLFNEAKAVTDKGAAVVVAEGDLTFRGTADSAAGMRFNSVHNVMVGVRATDGASREVFTADPSLTIDHAQVHADKHTRIGAGYDKDGAFWKTATLNVDNGSYVRFDTVHVGGDIGNVDLDHPPVVNINVDHGSSLQGWYVFNLNQSGRSDRRPKTLVNVRFDHGSSYVDYNGNNGLKFNNPGIDMTFDNGSVFGRTKQDWTAASIPGRLCFEGDSFDNHVRFLNGSTLMCDNLYLNATADWATNWLHFADSEWTAGDADFDFVFKNGHRFVFAAEGAGLKLNPPADRTWTMHSILTGTDIVKGGAGTLVLDRAKYLDNSTDLAKIKDNAKAAATLAITGTLRVNEGTVEIADAAAVAGTCALAVAADATVDLGGNKVAFTGLSGAGKVTNGSVEGLTYAYGDKVPTFDGLTGSVKVDFGGAAELKETYVVGHYTGAAPTALTVKAINTGLSSVKAVVTFEDGNIVVGFKRSGLRVLVY